ncbi:MULTISPECIES: signal recognition particle-docking protein FtsY [Pseudomonas]|uniref:signal recognition particle-docking protein FtsY n=1 Tax=Pseudomonas TaxID=286 RepID=UPI0007CF6526|nr:MULTISPECIES: signal recognition particle-docking protein FtsY [Pseudomonas]MDZ4300811.1 signal recognition particle-docking protein FtsY [Pseudomonas sp.]OAE16032.1 signal recognition particle-docking protein FtsY [Pseudomonas brenneri]MBJ2238913.1 signal recognition particle-docking protein FtsY [Pseudomonas sp. MF6768]MBJ2261745.1 signal recognition particle-docking protein FtsY [Pseudomonas sp. MF6787]MBJ2288947.1 signal recognition particle-docking protein FtsY [Pseudomonas sp. MF5691]
MFGSNDDKKSPAAAGEKKGLFGWLRKKPQETVVEQPQVQPEPVPEPVLQAEPAIEPVAEPVVETPAPVVLPIAEPVLQPEVEAAPEPEPEHKPWPPLPVAEEPVALVEDVQAEHVTPPIPVVVEPVQVAVEPQPVVVEPAPLVVEPVVAEPVAVVAEPVAVPAETSKTGFFARLKQGLSKTSASIGEGMASLFLGKKIIDDELLEDIETRLLTADVGVEATAVIIQSLTQKVARKQLTDADALYKSLQAELAAMLKPVEAPLVITEKKPFVILVVGVNGAGKTTTIGKLAKKLQLEGKKVMLAAGDTFRAAAVEQLQVWGERNKIPVIAQHTGADSASVIFDAVQAAKARNIDVLIADTAGRLHTKDNLMEELKKVRRVMGKLDADAPHEVLLVLDAGTGQNAISQAKQFNQTVQLTGLALTKLDGTAKGGVIFALAKQFGLPIRYIGVGEGIDDLRTFEAEPFVQALFAERERS